MSNARKVRRGIVFVAGVVAALAVGIVVGRQSVAPGQVTVGRDARDPYEFFDLLVDLRTKIKQNYVESVDDQKLMMGAINGMMSELDPYSNYLTKEDLDRFDRQVHGVFAGIGAEMSQDPVTKQFIIVSPLEDSPALKAGILAGDRLIKVNGELLENMSLSDLTLRVQGAPNTAVTLTVLHEGEKSPVDIKIVRDRVQVHSVKGYKRDASGTGWDYIISPTHRIAYVRITNFMESTVGDMDKALLPLFKSGEGLRGVILDLRFNPGGLLQAGVDVADRFLETGTIVSTRKPGGKDDWRAEAKKDDDYPAVPVVVLINEYSASASEIVAGALKDHSRALLIGTRSFGKGSVQNLITLDNGNAAMKLTTHYYYLPSGNNIAKRKDSKTWGVEPDAVFQMAMTDAENRALLTARARSEVIRVKIPGVPPVAGNPASTQPTTGPTTRGADELDKQLARALETLVANQVFNKEKPVPAVSTTRPEATVEVGRPETLPETKPVTRPETAPVTEPASKPAPSTVPDVVIPPKGETKPAPKPPATKPEKKPETKPETRDGEDG